MITNFAASIGNTFMQFVGFAGGTGVQLNLNVYQGGGMIMISPGNGGAIGATTFASFFASPNGFTAAAADIFNVPANGIVSFVVYARP